MGVFSFLSKKSQDSASDADVPVRPRRSRAAKSQDEEPIDPMLPEKKRARRRLIGATALVLAAIIGLPMVFDSEPKPLADDINIQIPPRYKAQGEASNAMPLSPEPAYAEAAPTEPAPPIKKVHAEPAPARVDQVAEATSAATAPAAPAAKPAADKPAEKHADKHAEKHPDKHSDKHADKDKGRYVVQVAAVSSKAKAEELQNRLKKAGLKAYSQKVVTKDGERFRIRVGPVAGRDEADKIRARLGKMGLSGTVQPA